MAIGYTWVEYVTQTEKKEISSISLVGSKYSPIIDADVYIKLSSEGSYAPGATVVTDASGSFSIELPAETYDIKIIKADFVTQERLNVVLAAGQSLELTSILEAV